MTLSVLRQPLKIPTLELPDIFVTKKSAQITKSMNFFKKLFSKSSSSNISIPLLKNPTGKIIAARVTKVEKHPNADSLQVVSLTDGEKEISPVVCGASNFAEGNIVVLALPSADIPQNIHSETHEPFTLGKAKIRGIESQGMICAEFELGLSKEVGDKPEIMILPNSVAPGTILGWPVVPPKAGIYLYYGN